MMYGLHSVKEESESLSYQFYYQGHDMTLEQALHLVTIKTEEGNIDIFDILDDVKEELSPLQFQSLLNSLSIQRVLNEDIYMQKFRLSKDSY